MIASGPEIIRLVYLDNLDVRQVFSFYETDILDMSMSLIEEQTALELQDNKKQLFKTGSGFWIFDIEVNFQNAGIDKVNALLDLFEIENKIKLYYDLIAYPNEYKYVKIIPRLVQSFYKAQVDAETNKSLVFYETESAYEQTGTPTTNIRRYGVG